MQPNPTITFQPTCARQLHRVALGVAAVLLLGGFVIEPEWKRSNRGTWSLDAGWRFHAGDRAGAEATAFDETSWTVVDVPHDWSITGARNPDAATGMGGGYVPAGVGWYRRTIAVPDAYKGQTLWLEFEGIYMNATLWLNGRVLGRQPYGYTSFRCDITDYVKPGASSVLAVRVDNSAQPNSRWYSGSGICRHVRLHAADAVHVLPQGVSVVTTAANAEQATLRMRTTVRNTSGRKRTVQLETRVLSPTKTDDVLVLQSSSATIGPRESKVFVQDVALTGPMLWSPDTPTVYTLASRVTSGDKLADVAETRFGIRTVRVSAEHGFELNGRSIKLNGANVHHDHGPLGAASFDAAEWRRVRLLKAAGFNAVRTAHNPPAPAFLDACDALGLLAMDEAFDCWEKGKNPSDYSVYFKDWWQRDLDAMILRDRNHPSVVMWSIGNEIQEVGRPEGIALAKALAKRVRELDPTRLVSCGWTVPWIIPAEWPELDPAFAAVDVAGYNYQQKRAVEDHARVPSRVMLATESYQAETFACWAVAQEHPYFIGDIVWTGWDYLGESGIGRVFPPGEEVRQHWVGSHWPWYGAYCGDIDITGWRKPISHYRNIVWDRGEKLFMAVREPTPNSGTWQPTMWAVMPTLDSWTWPGQEGKPLTVEIYSRHDRVRLFLNDKLIGEKPTTRAEEFKAVFEVPYEPGVLRAVGVSGENEAETFTLETAGPAVGVRLRPDWGETTFDQAMPTFLIAEIVDANGSVVPTSNARIEFSANHGAEIIAVATGDLTTPESFIATARRAWHGRAQVIVRPAITWDRDPKDFTVTTTVAELGSAMTTETIAAPIILSP